MADVMQNANTQAVYGQGTSLIKDATEDNILDIYQKLSTQPYGSYKLTPLQEKWLDNLLSQYNAQHNLLNEAAQLQALGLSSGNVTQTGGSTADQSLHNTAEARANREHEAQLGVARGLINLVTGLASAGIYGGARFAAQGALKTVAARTASSAIKVSDAFKQTKVPFKHDSKKDTWEKMIKELEKGNSKPNDDGYPF